MTIYQSIIHKFKYLSNVYIYMSTKENIKVNENIAVNESKNTTKFNKDNNNFNERTNNTLNQQQDDYSTIALWVN